MNKNNENREEEIAFKKALFSVESIQEAKKKIQDWLNPGTNYFDAKHAYHTPKRGFYAETQLEELLIDRNGNKRLKGDVLIYAFPLDLKMLKSMDGIELPDCVQSIDLSGLETAVGLKLPRHLEGDLELGALINAVGLELPKSIGGYLSLNALKNPAGLTLPTIVNSLSLNSIECAAGLKMPKRVGKLYMRDLSNLTDFVFPEKFRSFYNKRLTCAEGLKFPDKLEGDLYLEGLTTALGLKLPSEVGGDLMLNSLTSSAELVLPKKVGCVTCVRPAWGDELAEVGLSPDELIPCSHISEAWSEESANGGTLNLEGLLSADGLKLPESVGTLRLDGLQTAKGLVLPENIGWKLNLSGLIEAQGLKLPNVGESGPRHFKRSCHMIGEVDLSGLQNAKGVEFPDHLNADLSLNNLETAEGLVLPKTISGNLNLNGLVSAKGLRLPECVLPRFPTKFDSEMHSYEIQRWGEENPYQSCYYLDGLQSGDELNLPENFGGSLHLNGLTSAENLKLPNNVGGGLYLARLTSAEGLILPLTIGGSLTLTLTTIKGLKLPSIIGGNLSLNGLINAEGLILPDVKGEIFLYSLRKGRADLIKRNMHIAHKIKWK